MNIPVDSTAKAYAREEIIINTSAEKVYQVLADINGWPEWQSNVKSAEIQGTLDAGSRFIWNSGGFKIISKLHTVNPFTEFGWTGKMAWISAVHNWTFRERDGKCIVTVEESLKGFLAGIMKKSLQAGMKQSLAELKNFAERTKANMPI